MKKIIYLALSFLYFNLNAALVVDLENMTENSPNQYDIPVYYDGTTDITAIDFSLFFDNNNITITDVIYPSLSVSGTLGYDDNVLNGNQLIVFYYIFPTTLPANETLFYISVSSNSAPILADFGEASVFLDEIPNDVIFLSNENPNTAVNIQTKIFLQAAYNTVSNEMNTHLAENNILSLAQPFAAAPYNYLGTELLDANAVFWTNIVDWVLLEVRDATGQNIVEQQAAVLLKNGNIVDVNGELPSFQNLNASADYRLLVRHRNHLDVISASVISVANDVLDYDFSNNASQALMSQQTAISANVYALYAGDFDGDGVFTNNDFSVYTAASSALNMYLSADVNLDSHVTISDFNFYLPNNSLMGVNEVRY